MCKKNNLKLLIIFIGALSFISFYSCKKSNTSGPVFLSPVHDTDGNVYKTVKIGNQEWMVGALKVTHYNDGTLIPYIVNGVPWIAATTGARCYYGNNGGANVSTSDSAQYASTYGALYNWAAVKSGKLAPKGWHIADTAEWNTLISNLNGNSNFTGGEDFEVGGKLKEAGTSHWVASNPKVTNSSGFTALPAGYRNNINGKFFLLGSYCAFWTSTEIINDNTKAYCQNMNSTNTIGLFRDEVSKVQGLSVVCVRNH